MLLPFPPEEMHYYYGTELLKPRLRRPKVTLAVYQL